MIKEFLHQLRECAEEYDDETLLGILKPAAEKARSIAATALKTVYQRMAIA